MSVRNDLLSSLDQKKVEPSSWCPPRATQILTALALGVIIGAAAAVATYFLTPHIVNWSVTAGVGGCALVTLVSYIALRYCSAKPISTEEAIKEPETRIFTGKVKGLEIGYVPKVKNPLNRTELPQLIITVSMLSEACRRNQAIFYDPTNEIWVPLIRVYQEILMHPFCQGGKKEAVLKLFATELLRVYTEAGEPFLKSYLLALDRTTIYDLAAKVPPGKLQEFLAIYDKTDEGRKTLAERDEISRQLVAEGIKFYFGTALDDGSCLFHTMAQLLSNHFGVIISEKTLRMQCHDYMNHLEDRPDRWVNLNEEGFKIPWAAYHYLTSQNVDASGYQDRVEECQYSSQEALMNNVTPLWGETTIHAQIIAELYGVNFYIYEAICHQHETMPGYWDDYIDELYHEPTYRDVVIASEPQKIGVLEDKRPITLEEIGHKKPEATPNCAPLRIAAMGNHFFPIWTT